MTIHPSINVRRCARAILSLFSSSLAGAFDDIDAYYAAEDVADFGAAITCRDIVYYFRSLLGQYDAYPCMCLFPSGQQRGAGGDGGSFLIRNPQIEIVIIEMSNDVVGDLQPAEVMELRLERMVAAAEMLLDDNRILTIAGAKTAEIIDVTTTFGAFEYVENNPKSVRRSASLSAACIIK